MRSSSRPVAGGLREILEAPAPPDYDEYSGEESGEEDSWESDMESSALRDAEAVEYEAEHAAAIDRLVDGLQDAVIVVCNTLRAATATGSDMETLVAAVSRGTDVE